MQKLSPFSRGCGCILGCLPVPKQELLCAESHLLFPISFDLASVPWIIPSSMACSRYEMIVPQRRWIGNQRTWT